MLRSQITGVGSYVPSRVVTNFDLEKMVDTSDEWITKRTGIKERHWAALGEAPSDMALQAANRALESAKLSKSQLDMIVYATLSPDHEFPGTGCFLQAKLDVPGIPALDIRQQCTGFLYALSIADQYIRNGMYRNILVIGTEMHSRGLDKTNRGRDVAVLFGDGAGAVVVRACEVVKPESDSYLFSTHLHADGRFAKELWVPAPGSALPDEERLSHAMLNENLHYAQMNGKRVFVSAVEKLMQVMGECMSANQVSTEKVDLFLLHQANLRINEAVAEHVKIPPEKVFNTIHKFGNTTAATIPLGMDEAIKAGVLKKGMLVMLAAFGSGFTWGSALLRF
ncbi:MAG: ketoacyl-ACP synthase III [Deltaproteobacteria bacterium]|nr:ketoacyl-ACP synthase III [Deltaproteobacteria bacterium]